MTLSLFLANEKNSLGINLLICSLFTILPNDKLFKELNINRYYCSSRINEEFLLIDPLSLNNLSLILRKPLIRQLAYNILQPLLRETTNIPIFTFDIRDNSIDNQA